MSPEARGCIEEGKRRLYPLIGGTVVISENEVWIPGAYDSLETARAAFDLPQDWLADLQSRKNLEAGGQGGVITGADLGLT